jgi:hypothetical protein
MRTIILACVETGDEKENDKDRDIDRDIAT